MPAATSHQGGRMRGVRRMAALLAVSATIADAASHTWTGGGGNASWSTTSNWNAAAPTVGEANVDLTFPSVANKTAMNDLVGLAVRSISVTSGSYFLTG